MDFPTIRKILILIASILCYRHINEGRYADTADYITNICDISGVIADWDENTAFNMYFREEGLFEIQISGMQIKLYRLMSREIPI